MIEAATSNFVCRPADTTIGKIEDLFIDYLNRHPDKGEQSAVGATTVRLESRALRRCSLFLKRKLSFPVPKMWQAVGVEPIAAQGLK